MSELPTPSEIRARQEERAVAHELPPTPNGWALVQRTADGGMYRRLLTGQTDGHVGRDLALAEALWSFTVEAHEAVRS